MNRESEPVLETQIEPYEMAFRMQASVPEVSDISGKPKATLDLYGEGVTEPGTFAANCLLARRLAERDVPFVQVFHMDWEAYGGCPDNVSGNSKATDQASAALIKDLEPRCMLDDTLIGRRTLTTDYADLHRYDPDTTKIKNQCLSVKSVVKEKGTNK